MEGITFTDRELAAWFKTATSEQQELALQIGWRNVQYAQANLCRPSSPTTAVLIAQQKGKFGEDYVEKILREKYPDITVTAASPMSGDLTLYTGPRKTTIEVKNYTNPVPKNQVEKFRRDLSTAGAANGVFISLGQPISGITADFRFILESVDGRTVPCCYVVSSSPAQIHTAISMVVEYTDAIQRMRADTISRSTVTGAIRELSAGLDDLAGVRCQMGKQLADVGAKIVQASSAVMAVEAKMRDKLALLSDHTIAEVESTPAAMLSLPGYAKLSPDEKTMVGTITTELARIYGTSAVYLVTARKCTHMQSGATIHLTGVPKMGIVEVPNASIGTLITILGKKFSYNDTVLIEIAQDTIDVILQLLRGTPITLGDQPQSMSIRPAQSQLSNLAALEDPSN